jgi:glyoxylase-like metal-dependent hydrolase (beta-lactamase superfamily II)
VKTEIFECNPFKENSYLVWDSHTNEAMIIDPGFLSAAEEEQIASELETKKLNLRYIVNTHGHLDHIFGNSFLKEKYPEAKLLSPKEDVRLLKQAKEQAKVFGVECKESPMPDIYLDMLPKLTLGGLEFELLFTPGHTPGEYSLLNRAHKICFSGDVLFRGSIGRTDLWGGNLQTLMNSIKDKLFTLDDDVIVYPGHGAETTIGYEKNNNPFFF